MIFEWDLSKFLARPIGENGGNFMSKIPDPKKMKRIKGPVLTKQQLLAAKVRITTYLDQDILKELKNIAQQTGNKYQTVLNQLLRKILLGEKKDLFSRMDRLEKAVFSH